MNKAFRMNQKLGLTGNDNCIPTVFYEAFVKVVNFDG